MFLQFAKKICAELIADEFTIMPIMGKESLLSEETQMLLLAKNQSPLYYFVSILNPNTMEIEQYKEQTAPFLNQMEKHLNDYGCSRLVCIHVIPYKKENLHIKEWVSETELLPETAVLQTWWAIDEESGEITVGKGQPTEILNLKKVVKEAVCHTTEETAVNLKQMEQEIRKKTALRVRSTDHKMTMALIMINTLIYAVMVFSGKRELFVHLFADNAFFVLTDHQYYRMITSMFLHGNITHLGYNCLSLYIFGSRIETYFGKFPYITLYFFSGLGGSVASIFFTNGFSLGASGAIYGLLGGVLVLSLTRKKTVAGLHYSTILIFIILGIGIGLLSEGVDNYAHIGGLLSGCICALIQLFFIRKADRK